MNAHRVAVPANVRGWSLAALTAFATIACADDKPAANNTPDNSAFAQCSRAVLEADRGDHLGLQGPGVDPGTGQLAPGNYVVASTYLALKPDKAARALELGGPVIQSLFGMQGFVAFSTTQSSSCATLRSLTVWQSEEDMLTFVTSPAHAAAMSEVSELSRGSTIATDWEGSEKEVTWERAAEHLAGETGGTY